MSDFDPNDLSETSVRVVQTPLHSDSRTLFGEQEDSFVFPKDRESLLLVEAALRRSLETIERFKEFV